MINTSGRLPVEESRDVLECVKELFGDAEFKPDGMILHRHTFHTASRSKEYADLFENRRKKRYSISTPITKSWKY